MKKLVLIDGHSLLHRAFHAMPRLTAGSGEPTGAVYGFVKMIWKVIGDLQPDLMAFCFDTAEPTFRHKEFKNYKAQRPETAKELVSQIELTHRMIKAAGGGIYEAEGFEADDVIGTLAFQAKVPKINPEPRRVQGKNQESPPATGQAKIKNQDENLKRKNEMEVVIVSGDRDMLQLISDKVKVYCPLKGLSNAVLYNEALVWKKYGLRPEQLVNYKALTGDRGDNVPGVKGVGPKRARLILGSAQNQVHGSMPKDGQAQFTVDGLSEKEREEFERSRRLVKIRRDAPVELDLNRCRVVNFKKQEAKELFEELGFKSLLGENKNNKNNKSYKKINEEQMELF